MYPVIHIGPAAVQSSVFALLVALWLGTYVAERECKRRGLNGEDAWNTVAILAGVTVFAGRLIYVGQNASAYAADPLAALALTPNTLSLDLGVLFGILGGLAFLQVRRIPLLAFLDAFAPGALVAMALFAVGQFLSGDAYGMPSDLPWAILLWGDLRHPVQLYDALAAIAGFGVVWRMRRQATRAGTVALVALALYSAARVLIDAFRGDATVVAGGFRTTQVIALLVLLLALWLLSKIEGTLIEQDMAG